MLLTTTRESPGLATIAGTAATPSRQEATIAPAGFAAVEPETAVLVAGDAAIDQIAHGASATPVIGTLVLGPAHGVTGVGGV